MWYTMMCGCELEIEVYINSGCCDYCSTYADVDDVTFVSNCESHTATGDAV